MDGFDSVFGDFNDGLADDLGNDLDVLDDTG